MQEEEEIEFSETQLEDDNKTLFFVEENGDEVVPSEDEKKEQVIDNEEAEDPYDVYLEFEPEEHEFRKSYAVVNRKSYTVEEKLNIIKFAEENNNRTAARNFNMNESSVRCFRRQKEMLLKMNPQKKTNRKANPHWPKLEEELKDFVLDQNGTPKLKEIRQKALEIAERNGIEKFAGSNSYIFKFMQRHKISAYSPRPRKKTEGLKKS